MQKKLMASFALVAAFAFSAPANATSIGIGGVSQLGNTVGDSEATFNSVPGAPQTYGTVAPFGPFTDNGANFSGQGMLMLNVPGGAGGSLGLYAEPYTDTTTYLTVQPAGSPENIALNGTFTRFGLYWGSMDAYNTISFYRGGTLLDSLTGAQIAALIPALATGQQTDWSNNRYVEVSSVADGLGFDSVVLASTQNSFEVDNLSWGTPLPGALPLFASGMGGLGFLSWWRKRRMAKVMA